ncbi:hypothetical protein BN1232_05956 [Mycobacterium lentiflavum]|uniref:AtuA-like ferredoxin-fold domain-containing protein n=1 Tax=Mycobacterium lentiflavum TaxID=141349 RepID=A0A0E4H290_MYCLN|nr:hypothetical protein [Mycobacterium lentiflavum]CQD23944.1 hypothetical protein BN1232_05956 [Mycobacterium lentiflavum]
MPTIDELAFVRSGDKGDISNVVVLARDAEAFAALQQGLRPEAITSFMEGLVTGTVTVYTLPRLRAFNIVMRGALGGGATTTLRFDETGKSMCSILSRMPLPHATTEGKGEP